MGTAVLGTGAMGDVVHVDYIRQMKLSLLSKAPVDWSDAILMGLGGEPTGGMGIAQFHVYFGGMKFKMRAIILAYTPYSKCLVLGLTTLKALCLSDGVVESVDIKFNLLQRKVLFGKREVNIIDKDTAPTRRKRDGFWFADE